MVSEVNSEFGQAKGPKSIKAEEEESFCLWCIAFKFGIIIPTYCITEYLYLIHTHVLATCKEVKHLYWMLLCLSISGTSSRSLELTRTLIKPFSTSRLFFTLVSSEICL